MMKFVILALGFLAISQSASAALSAADVAEIVAAINSEFTAPDAKPLLEALLLQTLAEQGAGVYLPAIVDPAVVFPIAEPAVLPIAGPAVLPIAGPAVLPIAGPAVQPIVEPVSPVAPVASPVSSPLVQLILNIKTSSQTVEDLPTLALPSLGY